MLLRYVPLVFPIAAFAAGPTVTTFTSSGPIALSSGQTITGKHITSSSGPCIKGSNVTNVQIYDNKIGPCGADPDGNGIEIMGSTSNITIRNNFIDDVASGVYVQSVTGNNIVIKENSFRNARGPFTNGRGEYVQFDKVRGSGHKILCNVGEQVPLDKSEKEDSISIFSSSGTADSPIEIAYNKIRGGSSYNGSGIMTGDNGGEWIYVHHNNVIQTGGVGIGVAGGHNITVKNNKMYSAQTKFSNVGGTVVAFQGVSCSSHTFADNQINWTCGNADYCGRTGARNDFWDSGECGTTTGTSTNVLSASLDPTAMWNETFSACTASSSSGSSSPTPSSSPAPAPAPTLASCALPWGGTIASGSNVTAFKDSKVKRPARCQSESRTCTSGTLSGSYNYKSCTRTWW